MGNEVLYLLTSQGQYSLRVELRDWEGNSAYSQYDRFTLTSERQHYRSGRIRYIYNARVSFKTEGESQKSCPDRTKITFPPSL